MIEQNAEFSDGAGDKEFANHKEHLVLPLRKKIFYGLGGFGSTIPFDIQGGYLMLFYTNVVGVQARLVGVAMLVATLWDAVSDILMGWISDNTKCRWGRRRPYLLIGGPLFCVAFVLLFSTPASLSGNGAFPYLLAMAILFYTFSTVFMVPYMALGAEISLDYHDRTRLFAVRTVLERIGNFLVAPFWLLVFLPVFAFGPYAEKGENPLLGARVVTIALAVISGISFVAVFFGTREEAEYQRRPRMPLFKGLNAARKNVPFLLVTGAFLMLIMGIYGAFPFGNYINIFYVFGGDDVAAGKLMTVGHWLGQGISLVAIVFWGWVGTRIGKHRALGIGIASMACAPLFSWFVYTPEHPWLQLVFLVFLSIAVPAVTIFPYAMLADVADLDELRTGRRREGVYFAAMAFITKLGYAMAQFAVGEGLTRIGFQEGEPVQSGDVIFRLRLLLAIVPLAFMAIGVLLLYFYPLSETRVRRIRAILERRREEGHSPEPLS